MKKQVSNVFDSFQAVGILEWSQQLETLMCPVMCLIVGYTK